MNVGVLEVVVNARLVGGMELVGMEGVGMEGVGMEIVGMKIVGMNVAVGMKVVIIGVGLELGLGATSDVRQDAIYSPFARVVSKPGNLVVLSTWKPTVVARVVRTQERRVERIHKPVSQHFARQVEPVCCAVHYHLCHAEGTKKFGTHHGMPVSRF